MSRNTRSRGRSSGKKTRRRSEPEIYHDDGVVIDLNAFYSPPSAKHSTSRNHHRLIQARNQAQGQYMAAIRTNQLTFGLGPAGTGKTFCATAMAVEAFERREVKRLIFSRPLIESGESLGFLPGKLMDKLEPWFGTFRSYLADFLGRGVVDCAIKNERIVFEPLAYMRGKTFEDAFVILDEAQNCTRLQLKMFLTRIGECSRVVINGDTHQSDIGNGAGLVDAATRLHGLDAVHIHEFDNEDVVRSHLVRAIIQRYETG
ncbi:MAG: PhoH family protein [Gammaproteobacteria bacterium]|jgi:phosphate starvation-inducible PhoH-like protein